MPTAPPIHGHRKPMKRPTSTQRGYVGKWQRESQAWLKGRRCYYCGVPAECVDHIVAAKGDQGRFWDRANWRAACVPCNSRKGARSEGGFGNHRKYV